MYLNCVPVRLWWCSTITHGKTYNYSEKKGLNLQNSWLLVNLEMTTQAFKTCFAHAVTSYVLFLVWFNLHQLMYSLLMNSMIGLKAHEMHQRQLEMTCQEDTCTRCSQLRMQWNCWKVSEITLLKGLEIFRLLKSSHSSCTFLPVVQDSHPKIYSEKEKKRKSTCTNT